MNCKKDAIFSTCKRCNDGVYSNKWKDADYAEQLSESSEYFSYAYELQRKENWRTTFAYWFHKVF